MGKFHIFKRFVVSGDVVEIYEYSVPIVVGEERRFDIVKREPSKSVAESKRADNLLRARQKVRRYIWCNETKYNKFVTLTYAEPEFDIKVVKLHIQRFVEHLKRNGYDISKYLYVLEHQKKRGEAEGNKGSLHVHMLIFNDAYLPFELLNKAWKHGQTDIQAIDDVDNLGAYVSKYITKDSAVKFGSHVYGVSRGLKKPIVERFYIEGFSDSTVDIHPDEFSSMFEIKYSTQTRFDFKVGYSDYINQTVKYSQGRLKECLHILTD